jgi:hypothetical protein
MRLLFITARWELIFLIASIGAVTLWKLFKSQSFGDLLLAPDKTISPSRVQLLVLTLLTTLQYLLATIQDPSHLPQPPTSLVAAMGGSQLVYLGAKAWTLFGQGLKKSGGK